MSPTPLGTATATTHTRTFCRHRMMLVVSRSASWRDIARLVVFVIAASSLCTTARAQAFDNSDAGGLGRQIKPYIGAERPPARQPDATGPSLNTRYGSLPAANAPASTRGQRQTQPDNSASSSPSPFARGPAAPSSATPPSSAPPSSAPSSERPNERFENNRTATNDAPVTTFRGQLSSDEPIPLEPPDESASQSAPPKTPTGEIWTVITSLAMVLGLFFVVVFISRRTAAGGTMALPKEAFDVLGRAALAGRQQAQVVRFGDKLILLAVSATGVESLAEITSPDEVERVAGLCQQHRPDSVTRSFQQVLHQFSRDKTTSGFVESESSNEPTAEESVSEFERLA